MAKKGEASLGEVEDCFNKSIKIAREQESRSFELRSAMSMAKVWKSQGKVAEGLELVSSIYNWFQEGFETRDLMEAKHLIETLSVATPSAHTTPNNQSK